MVEYLGQSIHIWNIIVGRLQKTGKLEGFVHLLMLVIQENKRKIWFIATTIRAIRETGEKV